MGIQLCEVLLYSQLSDSKHKCLIAVVARAKIAFAKNFCHRDLRNLFTVTKNSKLRLSHKHFFPADKAGLTAFNSKAIIRKNLFHLCLRKFCLHFFNSAQISRVQRWNDVNQSKIEITRNFQKATIPLKPIQPYIGSKLLKSRFMPISFA